MGSVSMGRARQFRRHVVNCFSARTRSLPTLLVLSLLAAACGRRDEPKEVQPGASDSALESPAAAVGAAATSAGLATEYPPGRGAARDTTANVSSGGDSANRVPPARTGCSMGEEAGRVRVTSRADLIDASTGETFATAMPGDEFPRCRTDGGWAVVTIWNRRFGYRIRRSAVREISEPSYKKLSERQRNCVAADVARAGRAATGDRVREYLAIAQRRGLTIAQVADIAIEAQHRDFGPC